MPAGMEFQCIRPVTHPIDEAVRIGRYRYRCNEARGLGKTSSPSASTPKGTHSNIGGSTGPRAPAQGRRVHARNCPVSEVLRKHRDRCGRNGVRMLALRPFSELGLREPTIRGPEASLSTERSGIDMKLNPSLKNSNLGSGALGNSPHLPNPGTCRHHQPARRRLSEVCHLHQGWSVTEHHDALQQV